MGQGWDFHTFWPQGLASICVLQVLLELFVCSRRHEDTGALYVADMSQHCVRRLGPDGISYSCLACITWGRCLGNEIVRKTKVWGCTPGQVPGIVAGQQGLRGGSAGGVDCMGPCVCRVPCAAQARAGQETDATGAWQRWNLAMLKTLKHRSATR